MRRTHDITEKKTTITLSFSTKDKLDRVKVHPRQTYEEVINTLIRNQDKEQTKLI
jgi:predicted kinase